MVFGLATDTYRADSPLQCQKRIDAEQKIDPAGHLLFSDAEFAFAYEELGFGQKQRGGVLHYHRSQQLRRRRL